MKRSLFSLATPLFAYNPPPRPSADPLDIPLPQTIALYIEKPYQSASLMKLKPGDHIQTGQRLQLAAGDTAGAVSPTAGRVAAIEPYSGDFGRLFSRVTIDVDPQGTEDDAFAAVAAEPTLEGLIDYLTDTPGAPPLHLLKDDGPEIDTIVISGLDSDLLVATNQYVMENRISDVKKGIAVLKQIAGEKHIIGVVPRDRIQGFGHLGAELKAADACHPAGIPLKIMHDVFGKTVSAGQGIEDAGAAFFKAEAVAAMGRSVDEGHVHMRKLITVVDKRGNIRMVEAVIGTPFKLILEACGIEIKDRDSLIVGGPMTGAAVYAEDHPVQAQTDAIMVQDSAQIPLSSNCPCINCGECVRICPVNVPVNMLVRFLEAGQYETAAEEYDLYSCIECGLCSFVCPARIPIFQYIRLAKYELERVKSLEAEND